jgi:tungstate transport system substrate-binding protein
MIKTTHRLRRQFLALAAVAALGFQPMVQAADTITMASTTSTQASGLLNFMLPEFRKDSGIEVKVVAVGTGQAIDMAKRGDADVLFVHNKKQEEQFVADGFGLARKDVMYNDFVLIGPKADPAKAKGNDINKGLTAVAKSNAAFISRGDKSGTHAAELRYWAAANVTDKGKGYAECGCGMGAALNTASAKNAYVLSDRATWVNFKNKADLAIVVEGDKALFNQYGVIVVNPAKHPHVKKEAAQKFADWVVSKRGQSVIASYKVNGEQLFFANAK